MHSLYSHNIGLQLWRHPYQPVERLSHLQHRRGGVTMLHLFLRPFYLHQMLIQWVPPYPIWAHLQTPKRMLLAMELGYWELYFLSKNSFPFQSSHFPTLCSEWPHSFIRASSSLLTPDLDLTLFSTPGALQLVKCTVKIQINLLKDF